jgi:alginate O-acetyltransferase complex protein AlgI
MVFASLIFLFLFLPLNLLLYYSTGNKNARNWILVIFSLFFYAWGEPVWILVMIFSSSVDYVNAIIIEKNLGKPAAKIALTISIIIQLSLLVLFKYSAFLYENFNFVFGTHFTAPTFALPIGISFYTFQTISYAIDVYRGEVKAQRSYMKYMLFVSLYHQLVAGPIVRYVHIAHEIDNRKFSLKDMSNGISRFCIGLFKKVFFANVAGELAKQYLDGNLSDLSVAACWFGILMFTIQIYFDFSGYSDMAIGLGWMFGFHYHENFNYPYTARSATDFWRRWHISLGTFFRDYIYIPLGGNRKRFIRNLLVVWFLTGLWHGASWNFILWGLYFGVLIMIERLFLQKILDRAPRIIAHLYLLFAAVMGWALFYFTDLKRLAQFLRISFGFTRQVSWDMELLINIQNHLFWLLAAVLFCLPVYHLAKAIVRKRFSVPMVNAVHYTQILLNLVLLVVGTAMLVGKSYNPFLYFRF